MTVSGPSSGESSPGVRCCVDAEADAVGCADAPLPTLRPAFYALDERVPFVPATTRR